MNEIALANFYRVLNNEDRFPKEHELAEAAIAAKDELNSLRSHPVAEPASLGAAQAMRAAEDICAYLMRELGHDTDNTDRAIIAGYISAQHQPIKAGTGKKED